MFPHSAGMRVFVERSLGKVGWVGLMWWDHHLLEADKDNAGNLPSWSEYPVGVSSLCQYVCEDFGERSWEEGE